MESSRATIAAVIFIVVIVGINFFMYGIVRGLMRSSRKGGSVFETLGKTFNPAAQKKDDELQVLRQRIEELEKGKNSDSGTSK